MTPSELQQLNNEHFQALASNLEYSMREAASRGVRQITYESRINTPGYDEQKLHAVLDTYRDSGFHVQLVGQTELHKGNFELIILW